jgi:hypothetical protein
MVTLPPEFIATRFPGYFWNPSDSKLYSVKVTGELKPLKMSKASFFNKGIAGWTVSVYGQRRYLPLYVLTKLKPKDTVFPVYKQLELI